MSLAPTPTQVPGVQPTPTRPFRSKRRWWWLGGTLAFLVTVFYVGGGWYFAGMIRSDALDPEAPGEPLYDIPVLAVGADTVELDLVQSTNEHLTAPGVRGIAWASGYGWVGDVVSENEDSVIREYQPFVGDLTVGTLVDLDGFAFRDTTVPYAVPVQDVTFSSELGPMDAWFIPASGDTWVVYVHGRSAPLREALRLARDLTTAGYPGLVISYRNDVGAPEDPSGFYRYGLTEWRDVEAAVRYAIDHGAADVVVAGFSMGGGIVTSFLLESDLAADVSAVVLDAPMLDFGATVSAEAADRNLPVIPLPVPNSLTATAKWLAGLRFGVDWSALDYTARADELATPILLFHGTADDSVPIEPSQKLAELRPDLVEFHPVTAAGHVMSWNVDPATYRQTVETFLAAHTIG